MFVVRILLIACLYTISIKQTLFAQQNKQDSLLQLINSLPDNKEKVLAMNELTQLLYENQDDETAEYAQKLMILAKKIAYHEGIARAFDKLAKVEKMRKNFNKASSLIDSAIHYFTKVNEPGNAGISYNQKGILYLELNQFEQARVNFKLAQENFQKASDSLRLSHAYSNIGITFEAQGLHSTALEYYFKSLAINEAKQNKEALASDFMSIGVIFKRQLNLDKALEFQSKALRIAEEIGDEYTKALVLTNLGVIFKDLEKYDEAMEAQETAMVTFRKIGLQRGVMSTLHNIAMIQLQKGELQQAKQNVDESNSLARQYLNEHVLANNGILMARILLQQGNLSGAISELKTSIASTEKLGLLAEQHEATELLTEIYTNSGQLALALQAMRKSRVLNDSIYNLEKSKQIQELQTRYETVQKENQINLLNKEKALQDSEIKRKTLQQNMMLGGVGLLSLVAFLLFRSFTTRQKQKRAFLDKQLQQEKLEAERLHELDEAKSRFFANIAHEFRTPLTLIQGPAEQILDSEKDKKIHDNALLISQNADKLLSLVNQLLDLIKLESGMISLAPIQADFIPFAKGCVHSFESLAEEKDIKIIFNTEDEELLMDFDKEKTAIIFNNLMSNALKFTNPFGQVDVAIKKASINNGSEEVIIEISDTGIGIPEKQLPFIFDRFFQIDDTKTRKTQGTGIGLALVKELVELHKGSIRVVSKEETGTAFIINLPLSHPNSKPAIQPAENIPEAKDNTWTHDPLHIKDLSEAAQENSREKESEKVLVVEDNPDVRKFIVSILGSYYQVIESINGKKGLEKALEIVPDLVISDVMMPEMDGYDFCRQLKNDDRISHIPVIMLTAKAGLESKMEGLDTGADDYLAKPFNARELMARIKNLIKNRKRLQEKFSHSNDSNVFEKKENSFISRLKEVIEENIDKEEFNMDDLGKALAMSRTQVHRKLKALTNLSTSQFIRQYKLKKALEILKTGDLNVSEVAYHLGFNTPNYFSTCFTEHFGYPPSEVARHLAGK